MKILQDFKILPCGSISERIDSVPSGMDSHDIIHLLANSPSILLSVSRHCLHTGSPFCFQSRYCTIAA